MNSTKLLSKLKSLEQNAKIVKKKSINVDASFSTLTDEEISLVLAHRAKKLRIQNNLKQRMSEQKTGYIDPKTKKIVPASNTKMRMLITTEDDEALRKACHEGIEKTADAFVENLIWLVKKRNEYARACGYKNFYEFKAKTEERMSSDAIYKLFDTLSEKLQGTFSKIKELEKERP